MLRLIVGRAGTGKTHLCLEEICWELQQDPLGPPLLLLVPEEISISMERALLKQAGLKAIHRAQVLGFRRLRWQILQNVGGLAEPPLTDVGRKLLLAGLLQAHCDELTVFQGVTHHPGFVDKLSRTMAELQQANREVPSLTIDRQQGHLKGREGNLKLDGALHGGESEVADKAHDLRLILNLYQTELDQRGLVDDSWCWREAARAIGKSSSLEGAQVWVDGFHKFEGAELQILAALLLKAKNIAVTLRLDMDMMGNGGEGTFAHCQAVFEELIGLAEKLNVPYQVEDLSPDRAINSSDSSAETLTKPRNLTRFRSSEVLAYLEGQLRYPSREREPYAKHNDDIKVIAAPNYSGEAMRVARFLLEQARDHGVRWREMAVALSSMDLYGELLANLLLEWEVPFFLDRPQSIHWHPLMVFLSGLLEAASTDWKSEPLIQLLKSDLVQISRVEVDSLENYALARGIKGSLWLDENTWAAIERELGLESSVVRWLKLFANFNEKIRPAQDKPVPGRRLMMAMWLLLEQAGIPERLDFWAREAESDVWSSCAFSGVGAYVDHIRVWNHWVDLVDSFIQGLGDTLLLWDEFAALLQASLDSLYLSTSPQGLDQVLITTPGRLINSEVKVLVVMGADEKHLKVGDGEDTILNDGERLVLQSQGWPLSPLREGQMQWEPLFWYSLFTRAQERILITYSMADGEGKALEPAPITKDLLKVFPPVDSGNDGHQDDSLSDLLLPASISDAASMVAKYLRARKDGLIRPVENDWRNGVLLLYNWLAEDEDGRAALQRCLAGFTYTNQALQLSPTMIKELFGADLITNVHYLEAAARCPFEFFARAILRLEERDVLAWDARLEGLLWHDALARFSHRLHQEGLDLAALDDAKLQELSQEVWQATVREHAGAFSSGLESYDYRVNRLMRGFQRIAGILAEHARRGAFRPVSEEVAFGISSGLPPWQISISKGRSVYLRGRIDRIEAARLEDKLYLRVIDFKRGGRHFSLADVYEGFSLQLLAYLGVALENGKWLLRNVLGEGQLVPAGALYLFLQEPLINRDSSMDAEALEDKLLAEYKMRGVVLNDLDVIDLMEEELSGWSKLLPIGKGKNGVYRASSAYTAEEMDILVAYTRHRIRKLAEQILQGTVAITPYRRKKDRACTYCEFTALCRFELGVPGCRYRYIPDMSEEDALQSMEMAICEDEQTEPVAGKKEGHRHG